MPGIGRFAGNPRDSTARAMRKRIYGGVRQRQGHSYKGGRPWTGVKAQKFGGVQAYH